MDACVERESGELLAASGEFRKEQDGGNCSASEEDAEECRETSLQGLKPNADGGFALGLKPQPPKEKSSPASSDAVPSPATRADGEKRSWFPTRWLGLGKTRAAEKMPHIVHVDVDAFFASVEQVLNPKLRGKPVLVGRGVVASASYEAKFRGVKTAMSFRDALRLCPKAIVVPGQYEHYADFAERVRRILETYTPAVETAALDDFYLDFAGTERLYPDYEAMLKRLQAEILGKTGPAFCCSARGSSRRRFDSAAWFVEECIAVAVHQSKPMRVCR